jgi:hypothetical protein
VVINDNEIGASNVVRDHLPDGQIPPCRTDEMRDFSDAEAALMPLSFGP